MELPKTKVKALPKSPKNMVIYGPPKIGKTTALSKLEGCLIIDLEEGSDMVEALKIAVDLAKERKCESIDWDSRRSLKGWERLTKNIGKVEVVTRQLRIEI